MTKLEDPNFNLWWVKKYCTFTAVDEFVLYFPYILLVMPLVIFLIEEGFKSMFKSSSKLEAFYKLLLNEDIIGKT